MMRSFLALALLVVAASAATINVPGFNGGAKLRYDNYSVYSLKIRNKIELSVIELLSDLTEKYNIWKDYDDESKEVHIMVRPDEVDNFKKLMAIYGLQMQMLIPDVQKLIDDEAQPTERSATDNDSSFGWTRYYDLHEIEAWLDGILKAHPEVTSEFIIGKSYEGRNIRGIKISHKPNNPGIFIESNIHAREWITSATATWFINQLLTSEKAEVKNLAQNYDWYIIPVFNVDGFVYSHETDRMWRKTRQPNANSRCIGTDANRNFDSHWMENNGASSNECSETFAGPKPFSEPEAEALSKYVTSIKDKINIYLSFHSYGQWLLSPYGHTKEETPPNYNDLLAVGAAFANAISGLQYSTKYVYGSTATTLYVASGSSVDWVFNELNVGLGFTIEYRDKGRYGFVLPPVQIIPNCEELMAGMVALVAKAKDLKYV